MATGWGRGLTRPVTWGFFDLHVGVCGGSQPCVCRLKVGGLGQGTIPLRGSVATVGGWNPNDLAFFSETPLNPL